MTTITASLLCLGDELLDGRVDDLNTATIARALATHDTPLIRTIFLRDDPDTILAALRDAHERLVIVTGGLGPTEDDRTRQVAARLVDAPLEEDAEALAYIEERFRSRGRQMSPNNLIQARFPRGATILPSQVGTASGFMLDAGETRFVFLPGVPQEVTWFMNSHLDAMLDGVIEAGLTEPRATRTFTLFGRGESHFEQALLPLPDTEEPVQIGWRARDPLIDIKLTSTHTPSLEAIEAHVRQSLGKYIIAEGGVDAFGHLGELLVAAGGEVTCAESCTGGLIAAAMTEIPGSSRWFGRGFVTYSNQSKKELVGVLGSVLEAHGAVSPQTVVQMAAGARQRAGATHAVAVSGIAGPGGGTPEKPVGTVHFAIATPHGVYHHHARMPGRSREQVRQRSVYIGSSMLLWSLRSAQHDVSECIVSLTGPHDEEAIWQPRGIEPPSPLPGSSEH